jgi:bacillithiol system protein YtxJ
MVFELRNRQDFERLLEKSHQNPVVVFKHSTQCSVSADALDELKAFVDDNRNIPCGMLLVIERRALSDEVEARFGIRHESPQAFVVVNGTPVWHASHGRVTAEALQTATNQSDA